MFCFAEKKKVSEVQNPLLLCRGCAKRLENRYIAVLLRSFSSAALCLVDKGLLMPIAIAFRSSLVVEQINKIQSPQSGTPLRLLQI